MPTCLISEWKGRDVRLDALRGLFLVIMAAVHLPTPLSHLLQEPFGYNSMAEGFVFLGACLAGYIYGTRYARVGWDDMSRRTWRRARQIYLVHISLLIPFALLAWVAGHRLIPLANHFHDFLLHPRSSLLLMLLLLHQPPLFDILPLYVILLGATPFVLCFARKRGWLSVLLVSGLGWLIAQFGSFSSLVGDSSGLLRLGSFNLPAWQFLWVCGLALGQTALSKSLPHLGSRSLLSRLAVGIVLAGLLSRHGWWPQAWFSPEIYRFMDKWTLGPLRLLNLAAWVTMLISWRPPLPLILSPLALLGRHGLSVFAFHLPVTIAATVAIQSLPLSSASQICVGLLAVAALFLWAWLHEAPLVGTHAPKPVTTKMSETPNVVSYIQGF